MNGERAAQQAVRRILAMLVLVCTQVLWPAVAWGNASRTHPRDIFTHFPAIHRSISCTRFPLQRTRNADVRAHRLPSYMRTDTIRPQCRHMCNRDRSAFPRAHLTADGRRVKRPIDR